MRNIGLSVVHWKDAASWLSINNLKKANVVWQKTFGEVYHDQARQVYIVVTTQSENKEFDCVVIPESWVVAIIPLEVKDGKPGTKKMG